MGASARCLLTLFGAEDFDESNEVARANVGALKIAEAIHDLKLIRQLLTPKE